MGAFNTVSVKQSCPSCKKIIEAAIQFKYGETRQIKYQIGDRLKWGGNDTGKPGAKRVVLSAIAEDCPACGAEGNDCEVWIEDDRIVSITPVSGKYDFVKIQEVYIVVEE